MIYPNFHIQRFSFSFSLPIYTRDTLNLGKGERRKEPVLRQKGVWFCRSPPVGSIHDHHPHLPSPILFLLLFFFLRRIFRESEGKNGIGGHRKKIEKGGSTQVIKLVKDSILISGCLFP